MMFFMLILISILPGAIFAQYQSFPDSPLDSSMSESTEPRQQQRSEGEDSHYEEREEEEMDEDQINDEDDRVSREYFCHHHRCTGR